MDQQQVAMFGHTSWIPVHPATTTMTAAAPLTDTGIRLKPRGQLALYSCMDVEALGVICPGCTGLVCHLKPFGQCEACGEFLFEVDPVVQRPRTIYPGRASGNTTRGGGIAASRAIPAHTAATAEEVVVKTQREKSEDADSVTTLSQRPPPKKRTSVVAPTSGGGGQSRQLTQSPDGSVDQSSGRLTSRNGQGKPGEGSRCLGGDAGKAWPGGPAGEGSQSSTVTYIPAEECDTSDLESLSDLGDDTVIDELFAEKGWDKLPLAAFRRPRDSPMSTGESTPRVKASKPEDESCPQPTSTTPVPPVLGTGEPRPMLRAPLSRPDGIRAPRHPDSIVLPGEGDKATMPPLARLQRRFGQKVAADYGWEYPYLSKELLFEVEVCRERWYDDFVWTHLKVPHARRYLACSSKASQRFKDCKAEWMLGRHIHADKVVIKRKEGDDVVYRIETMDGQLKPLVLPHPRFYL